MARFQTSSWFDSDLLRNRQQKHTAKALWAIVEKTIILLNKNKLYLRIRVNLLVIIIFLSVNLFSQIEQSYDNIEEKSSITVGLLQGGGSFLGADMEFLISDQVGFQLGFGYVGFGGGLNYHFNPSIRSSFISFQYWNQGISYSFSQNAVGPSFVYRGEKWVTFQIGLGVPIKRSPEMIDRFGETPVMFLYAIGAYIPINI